MEQAFIEMIKNAPWAAALILIVKMFLDAEKQREATRVSNATEASKLQRDHEIQIANIQRGRELEINNLWATTVKNMAQNQDNNHKEIVGVMHDIKITISEQYKNLGITQKLLDGAMTEIRGANIK